VIHGRGFRKDRFEAEEAIVLPDIRDALDDIWAALAELRDVCAAVKMPDEKERLSYLRFVYRSELLPLIEDFVAEDNE
jgi:hypothetical protein